MNSGDFGLTRIHNYVSEQKSNVKYKSAEWRAYVDSLTILEEAMTDVYLEYKKEWENLKGEKMEEKND
jgi:hypothetical protein